MKNGRSGIFADIASLQRDGFATDTKVIAVDDDCRTASPILAHSLVLAATSPALANLLLSTSGPPVLRPVGREVVVKRLGRHNSPAARPLINSCRDSCPR